MAVPQHAPTTIPKAVVDLAGDGRWMSQHNRFIAETHDKEPEVVFLGDSLIQQLQDTNVWRELFQPLHCLNFGIGGETTQNLLWRIAEGTLDVIKPKVIVLLIGTNNFLNTAGEVAEGILEIVRLIREKQPLSQLLVLELLPRGEKPNRQREKNSHTNQIIREQLRDTPRTAVINLDPGFVAEDGLISPQDMPDYVHLTDKSYRKAFTPLRDIIIRYLDSAELPSTSTQGGLISRDHPADEL
ncbi:Platelet-activating factor acetylhydrolase IB subunit beta [Hypsibius exemplaris]|uniref:Platelet-activating factor acetylhydrolase IB subunit beta n=1 Tax=Hypsibius exemplaris TaxID=2072580 RepID=A0A1W0WQQ4_HYPEX|nr:Platelet-activating factor acetylhydrolase IB subunit beta [Hypsibius exemplaris]